LNEFLDSAQRTEFDTYPETPATRSFLNIGSGEMIELEPGGSDTTGHFLHHMKAFD